MMYYYFKKKPPKNTFERLFNIVNAIISERFLCDDVRQKLSVSHDLFFYVMKEPNGPLQ
jgi:hypothetical protein